MKKMILVIAAMTSIALASTQAFACSWDGYWGGPMGGPMAGPAGDNYDSGNYQAFYDKTAQLRLDLAAKQGEYNALMSTPKPDPKQAANLSREITVLHDQLSAEARSLNLPNPNNGHHAWRGGYGMGGYGYNCGW